MLPTKQTDGQPYRELTTFRVHDGERVFVGAEAADGRVYEKLRVQESGRFALMPVAEDIQAKIVSPGELEQDVDLSEMRIVGEMGFIGHDDDATAEFRIDGAPIADSGARGQYGLFWVPIVPE